eukprot:scaffold179287_cov50-Prasinocladus_malaysianus.AAC.1
MPCPAMPCNQCNAINRTLNDPCAHRPLIHPVYSPIICEVQDDEVSRLRLAPLLGRPAEFPPFPGLRWAGRPW